MFESLNETVNGILAHGDVIKEEKINGILFKVKPLNAEETMIAHSINALKEIKDDNNSSEMETFNDVFETSRYIVAASLFIVEMNGVKIHDVKDSGEEKLKKAKELRSILRKLPLEAIRKLTDLHLEAVQERSELLNDIEKTVGK